MILRSLSPTPHIHDHLSPAVMRALRCPICHSELVRKDNALRCHDLACAVTFPIVDGIPVLLNEGNSLFTIAACVQRTGTTWRLDTSMTAKIRGIVARFAPNISLHVASRQNYEQLAQLLVAEYDRPRVLIVGGSIVGKGMKEFLNNPAIEFVETDVSFGIRTGLICDAHDLPFADGSFDCVVIQAVMEYLVDPNRCVEEIHRVLKQGGLVYAETPFMQQVHGGRYDFTRFTHLGVRRLFRHFDEVMSGAVCGPAMAMAWSIQYFLYSFVTAPLARFVLKAGGYILFFWLKYFDYLLINRPGALDAASAYYFLGRKTCDVLSDRAVIETYRGLVASYASSMT